MTTYLSVPRRRCGCGHGLCIWGAIRVHRLLRLLDNAITASCSCYAPLTVSWPTRRTVRSPRCSLARAGSSTSRGRHLPCVIQPSDWSDRKSTRLNSSHLGISYAVFPTHIYPLSLHDALPISIRVHRLLRLLDNAITASCSCYAPLTVSWPTRRTVRSPRCSLARAGSSTSRGRHLPCVIQPSDW